MNAVKPWYFKDGTPFTAAAIGRLVKRAGLIKPTPEAPAKEPKPESTRRLIGAIARYAARRMEEDLKRMLVDEIERFRPIRFKLTGDEALDAKRRWRRIYQREYRGGSRRKA